MTIDRTTYRRAFLLLLVAAIAVRLGWALWKMHQGLDPAIAAEAFDEARHVAAGQGLAGAYGDDRPTAHLLPIPPLIAGGVYALLGVATPAAELTLWAYATALAIARIVLFERSFALLGLGRAARLGAVTVLALASPYLSHEAVTFRTWEGALAAAVEAAFLFLLLRWLARTDMGSAAGWAAPVAVAALLFFINPPLGLAAIACLAVAAWPRRRRVPIARMALTGAAVLALLIGPWAWRNAQVLGRPVLLRSNAGLELALSMRPDARTTADPRRSFGARIDLLHPRHSAQAHARMAAMGEVAYAAALGRDARGWMAAHPAEAATLMARHVAEQLFPPAWVMDTETGAAIATAKALVASVVAAFGLAGFGWMLARKRWRWGYPALLVAVPVLLMAPFEPYHRYIFLLFTPLAFAGAGFVEAMASRLVNRGQRPPGAGSAR